MPDNDHIRYSTVNHDTLDVVSCLIIEVDIINYLITAVTWPMSGKSCIPSWKSRKRLFTWWEREHCEYIV